MDNLPGGIAALGVIGPAIGVGLAAAAAAGAIGRNPEAAGAIRGVFILGIRNLSQLAASDARLHSETLRAFGRRLQNCVKTSGEIGMPGRWSEDCFAIVFNLPLSGVPIAIDQLRSTLGGNYAIQLDGESHIVSLDLRVQAVERPKGGSEGAFFLSLGQAAFSVTAH